MSEYLVVKNSRGDLVVSSPQTMSLRDFVQSKGFIERRNPTKSDVASHSDLGVIKEYPASEMFLLIETSGFNRGVFFKTVKDEEEARNIITDMHNKEKEYGYSLVGTSIYLVQDLKEFRCEKSE